MPDPIRVEIYSRPGCHLCEEAHETVGRARARRHFELQVIDIERDPRLEEAYGSEIPVIFINGNEAFRHRVDEDELERKLDRLWKT
jgi:glutaredoxin